MHNDITQQIEEHIRNAKILLDLDVKSIIDISRVITTALFENKKVYIMGNGGSAADAQHFAAELSGKFMMDRAALPVICLNTNVSTLTAISNDYGFDRVFERQIEGYADPGDVVIGISTSGDSENINKALEKARDIDCTTIGLIGRGGGRMRNLCEYKLDVKSLNVPRIQEMHILAIHLICDMVEKKMFQN